MKELKLKDILPDNEVYIEYRTHTPDGDDCLFGFCHWDGNKLWSSDGDNYSTEDVLDSYEWDGKKNLTVWYKSQWVTK